jgi:CheY-like chemotaxis protein
MTERTSDNGMTLPNSPMHPGFDESTSKPREGWARTTGRRILIVDDNVDAADSLDALLKLQGHETCVAYGGADALAAFRSKRFDLALIDIRMPGMDGYELVHLMRAANVALPLLVAVTGLADDASRRKARAAGFEHYVVKPYEVEALDAILEFRVERDPTDGAE